MAKERLTDKTENSSLHNDDLLHSVDVSDTSSHAEGTSKKVKLSTLYNWIKSLLDIDYGDYVTRWASWAEVTGKPSTFTPSTHTHTPEHTPNNHMTEAGAFGNVTVDLEGEYNVAIVQVTNAITDLDFQDAPDGKILFRIENDATGRSVTLNARFLIASGSNDNIVDATSNAVTNLLCWYDSTLDKMFIEKNIVE